MIDIITEYFAGPLGKVELFGTIFSAICVYLAVKQNIWTWFWGTLGVLCFGYLFFQYQLYSDAGLQILFFLPMQVLGYIWWRGGLGRDPINVKVKALPTVYFALIIFGIMGVSGVNGYLMETYTDASFPYVDALTTWMSVAAQILMIAKYRESWVLWVTMDIIAIFVYLAKGLVVTSGLYFVFLILATLGGIAWYRDYQNQEA